ncbi:MAG: phage major capsid protein [Hydrogenophaga sp.]|nr:phage major capsid protein [Hydrogenophaga sp.]
MSDRVNEAIEALEKMTAALEEWKGRSDGRIDDLSREVREVVLRSQRPGSGTSDEAALKAVETWIDVKTKARVPVLDHKHSLAALEKKTGATPSMGRVLRGIVLAGQADDAKELAEERKAMGIAADTAGGFTVDGVLASEWIDLFRSQMVLSQAGVRTVPMSGNSLTLAKLTGDPSVTWHGENASLSASEATLGAVSMTAKTATCLVKMSLELSQDSANIEQILQSSMTAAIAHAVDKAGLVGVAANAGAAPMTGAGILNLAGRNSVGSIGAPDSWDFLVDGLYELMVDNVPMDSIGAMIAHPAVWKTMTKLKTGIADDNTPLPVPEAVARVPKLWTTAAPLDSGSAKAMVARWSDLLMGVRQSIQVHVLREAFMGSNLQVGVLAYVRCDFAATRAESFCSLEGITV